MLYDERSTTTSAVDTNYNSSGWPSYNRFTDRAGLLIHRTDWRSVDYMNTTTAPSSTRPGRPDTTVRCRLKVNEVTKELFSVAPDPQSLSKMGQEDVQRIIR